MKNELRNEALSVVLPKIREIFPDAVDVCVSNKNMIAIDTGKVDEEGRAIYATIDVTIKDNEATKTREGFSLEAAVAAYEEKATKATERKAKTPSAPKNTEAAEKRNKRMVALREWWTNEANEGVGYTSTMVKDSLPDIYAELTIMQVGSDMKMLSEMIPTDCEMRVEEGKKHYYKH
jgi:hypothetical protein